MSVFTMPCPAVNQAPGAQSPTTELFDLRTDEGLRHVLRAVQTSGSWDTTAGRRLLAELRRRPVRNAAHVATAVGTVLDRGLVDDVLLAAWLVLRRHGDKVAAAARPWAYVMSSAQRLVLDEVQAQQLLTDDASIRGRTREVLPGVVRPVGSSADDLARALGHEHHAAEASAAEGVVRQVRRHEKPPLLAVQSSPTLSTPLDEREPWFAAFIDLLVRHGADEPVTVVAVDRLADLFAITPVGWWEHTARRDPVLAALGLRPEQCAVLVALLAGSRRYRHNGKHDSLMVAVRHAVEHAGE